MEAFLEQPDAEALWGALGAVWLRASLRELTPSAAVQAMVQAVERCLHVSAAFFLPPHRPPPLTVAMDVRGPAGELLGYFVLQGEVSSDVRARLTTVLARLLGAEQEVYFSTDQRHQVRNALAVLLANLDFAASLVGEPEVGAATAEDKETFHHALALCVNATQELVQRITTLTRTP